MCFDKLFGSQIKLNYFTKHCIKSWVTQYRYCDCILLSNSPSCTYGVYEK